MAFGLLQVAALLGLLVPGHADQPVHVVARDGGLGRHRRHRLEALQLLDGLLLDVLRHPGFFDLLLELVDLVPLLVLAAQFLLDRLHLLVEVVLLLRLLHLLLDARLDAAVDLELVHLGFEDAADAVQPFERRDDFEQVLLLVDAHHQVGRDRVGQPARIVHAHGRDHRVVVQVVRELHVLLEQRHHPAHRAFDVARHVLLPRQDLHHDAEEAPVLFPLDGPGALDALDEHLDVAVGQLQALHDVADAAHRVDVLRLGVIGRRLVLGREKDALLLAQGMLERPRRGGPPDDERDHHVRKDHEVAQRNDWEGFVDFHVVCYGSGPGRHGPPLRRGRAAEAGIS